MPADNKRFGASGGISKKSLCKQSGTKRGQKAHKQHDKRIFLSFLTLGEDTKRSL